MIDDPKDLRIVSDNRHDDATIARLAPGVDFSRRAAAGLLTDLAPTSSAASPPSP